MILLFSFLQAPYHDGVKTAFGNFDPPGKTVGIEKLEERAEAIRMAVMGCRR